MSDLSKDPSKVALHIFTALELITFFFCSRTLVHHTEMIFISNTVDYTTMFEYIVRNCYEGSPATAGFHLMNVFVARAIYIRTRQVESDVIMVVEGTDLLALATIDAFTFVNKWI